MKRWRDYVGTAAGDDSFRLETVAPATLFYRTDS